MKVTLEKTFPMPASADTTWTLLQDIPAVAACMPGANITEQIDATHYKGTVAVKLGPASMSFRGDIEVMSVDAAAKSIRLVGRGTDTTGGSGASMDLTARLEATGDAACNLLGNSDVSMSGKAAAFGGRMMGSVADQILKQFAANFANRVRALQAQGAAPPPAAGAAARPPAVAAPVDAGASGRAVVPELPKGRPNGSGGPSAPAEPSAEATPRASAPDAATDSAAAPSAPPSDTEPSGSAPPRPASAPAAEGAASADTKASAASQPQRPQPVNELNALALIWAVFKDWLRSLFGAKRA